MAIDPALLAQVKWDDEPASASAPASGAGKPMEINITGGISESQLRAQQAAAAARPPIDLSQVVWDDEKPAPPQGFGYSGVSREERQRQIADADKALDYDARLGALNRQQDVGRTMALGGRAIMGGAVSLPDIVVSPIVAGVNHLLPDQYKQGNLTQGINRLADLAGAPQPETANERIGSDMLNGIAGAATGVGFGNSLASLAPGAGSMAANIGKTLQESPLLQMLSAGAGAGAASATREAGGGTGAQLGASLAAGLGPSALTTLAGAGARGFIRGTSGAQMQRTINDFKALGATPSVGQASGSKALQGIENLLASAPTSTGVMTRFAEHQADDVGSGLQKMSEMMYRNASGERAGRAIKEGIRGDAGFMNSSRESAGQLYSKLDELIPKDSRVSVDNVRQALASLNSEIPGAPSVSRFFQNARLQGIEGALQQDTGGIEGVLSRPGMRDTVDQMRSDLTAQAASRRAELAQEANAQRQEMVAEAGRNREYLQSEAQRMREKIASAIESRRQDLYRQADEQRMALSAEQQEALRENERLRALGMNNLRPVLTDAEINARVPTYAQIDAQLPGQAEIDAHIPSGAEIEAQVQQPAQINQRVSPDSAWRDPAFGQQYIDKQINEYLAGHVDNKLPYEALQKLRTLVGGELEGSSLLSDVPRSKWKAVYGALSKDMEAAASTPEAKQALSRANAYFNARIKRIDAIDHVIDRNGGPEKIYSAVMGSVQDGGTTLRSVMQSLPPDGQKAVTAAVIKRMGMATPNAQDNIGGVFSASTFLTNWNKISPEAKRALFDRHGMGFSQSMDQIARVVNNIKQGSKVYANPSGTANRTAALTYGGTLVGSILQAPFTGNIGFPALAVAGGAGANVLARILTSPRAVTALAETTKMPRGAIIGQIHAMNRAAQHTGDDGLAAAATALHQAHEEDNDKESRNH